MTAYDDGRVSVHLGDCLDVLRSLPDASVDAVVTDPPYGLEFMGKEWDAPWKAAAGSWADRDPQKHADASNKGQTASPHLSAQVNKFVAGRPFQDWCEQWATECLRVLKPGGHMLAFGGTRTWHRLACAVEDAGFEVRDSIAWLYGSGFPKSLDVSKAIDKAAGAERETKGWLTRDRVGVFAGDGGDTTATSGNLQCPDCLKWKFAPDYCKCPRDNGAQTPDAERWQGWGTALKPAFEPVVVARKPLRGTVAGNVLEHGTGALNVDACRVEGGARPLIISKSEDSTGILGNGLNGSSHGGSTTAGRWPANVVLDESQAAALDEQSGESVSTVADRPRTTSPRSTMAGGQLGGGMTKGGHNDSGGASRFFYVAKAPKRERPRSDDGTAHPTVKPLDLMRWLVRLVTPPGGLVLEPFAGSGTTVEACIVEGFRCIAIEREPDYLPLILQRIHRRRDPVAAIRQTGDDLGLFELDGESA